jgi:anti-sigma28 factor (negative regulator of flagellin synthesis)
MKKFIESLINVWKIEELKNEIQKWGEYNVVMELKHAKPRMGQVLTL